MVNTVEKADALTYEGKNQNNNQSKNKKKKQEKERNVMVITKEFSGDNKLVYIYIYCNWDNMKIIIVWNNSMKCALNK